jgi:hypothetical protein
VDHIEDRVASGVPVAVPAKVLLKAVHVIAKLRNTWSQENLQRFNTVSPVIQVPTKLRSTVDLHLCSPERGRSRCLLLPATRQETLISIFKIQELLQLSLRPGHLSRHITSKSVELPYRIDVQVAPGFSLLFSPRSPIAKSSFSLIQPAIYHLRVFRNQVGRSPPKSECRPARVSLLIKKPHKKRAGSLSSGSSYPKELSALLKRVPNRHVLSSIAQHSHPWPTV